MKYEIVFANEAVEDFKRFSARERAILRTEIEHHLRAEPQKTSQSRIKRLRGMRRPQYRLRVGELRVYYEVIDLEVHILAIVRKMDAADWLNELGEKE
jgi:mRNA-degrading endonuclease RelE of RelBE toxin-antitoxin system